MTDVPSHLLSMRERLTAWVTKRRAARHQTPIVPPRNVAGRALMTVIAIMTFLASLTVGAVILVSQTAAQWQNEVAREVTVQVKPRDGLDMAAALETVRATVVAEPGVVSARVLDDRATSRLLEPWLGRGVDLEALPVPRLVVVAVDPGNPPDFGALQSRLAEAVPAAELDNHRAWISRLVSMARATVIVGLGILILVLSATVMTVVFATRGAMSGNRHVIEVLHFVGARSGFIAGEFQQHFLRLGLIGAVSGGAVAIVVFVVMGWWVSVNRMTPEADQINALFGSFSIGFDGYFSVAVLVAVVGALTALTSRLTVTKHLAEIDMISPVESQA